MNSYGLDRRPHPASKANSRQGTPAAYRPNIATSHTSPSDSLSCWTSNPPSTQTQHTTAAATAPHRTADDTLKTISLYRLMSGTDNHRQPKTIRPRDRPQRTSPTATDGSEPQSRPADPRTPSASWTNRTDGDTVTGKGTSDNITTGNSRPSLTLQPDHTAKIKPDESPNPTECFRFNRAIL